MISLGLIFSPNDKNELNEYNGHSISLVAISFVQNVGGFIIVCIG